MTVNNKIASSGIINLHITEMDFMSDAKKWDLKIMNGKLRIGLLSDAEVVKNDLEIERMGTELYRITYMGKTIYQKN